MTTISRILRIFHKATGEVVPPDDTTYHICCSNLPTQISFTMTSDGIVSNYKVYEIKDGAPEKQVDVEKGSQLFWQSIDDVIHKITDHGFGISMPIVVD